MLSRMLGAALFGIETTIVRVEVHGSKGLPAVNTVGLPDSAVRESRERVRSALLNSGLKYPQGRLTVNLAPADIRKAGSCLDLPMAVAIAALDRETVDRAIDHETLLMGELSLDGSVRPVPGTLSAAMAARDAGLKRILVPASNVREAAVVTGIDVFPVSRLDQAIRLLNNTGGVTPFRMPRMTTLQPESLSQGQALDMADVRGQAAARRALEVAAAGGHNLLLLGPPGSGKTMLARRMPTILPPLTLAEATDITRVHSAAGRTGERGLITTRPFRSPHHTATDVALTGGGSSRYGIKPGEVSLAHHGVLFLDELPEFRRHALEALRQPLEDGMVTVSRAIRTVAFPAEFTLVAAMNP